MNRSTTPLLSFGWRLVPALALVAIITVCSLLLGDSRPKAGAP